MKSCLNIPPCDFLYSRSLSLYALSCRVIQKALRHLGQEDVSKLITEFHDKVIAFIHDPNGNHVIQKSIQAMSSFAKDAAKDGDPDLARALADKMEFIVDDIVAGVEPLSTHRYGCRVVQRALEYCVDEQRDRVLEGMAPCLRRLATDQYGNYVVQQVLACGGEAHRAAVVGMLTEGGALLDLSKHKYASNVVESVLVHGKPHHKETILEEMLKASATTRVLSKNLSTNLCLHSVSLSRIREEKPGAIAA